MVRIHSPRPIPSIIYRHWTTKQPTQLPTQFAKLLPDSFAPYTAGMAKNAATHPSPAPSSASQPADSRPALAPVIEINVRHIDRTPQPEKLTGSEAPEGWIKKIGFRIELLLRIPLE